MISPFRSDKKRVGQTDRELTSEILRAHPNEAETFFEIVADRAIDCGLKPKVVRTVIHELPHDLFLELYYEKSKERFLARFAPLYYRAAGEPQIGPLFEEPNEENNVPPAPSP